MFPRRTYANENAGFVFRHLAEALIVLFDALEISPWTFIGKS